MTTSVSQLGDVASTSHTTEELLLGDSDVFDQLSMMVEKGINLPVVYWQIAYVLICLLLGWLCWYLLKKFELKRLLIQQENEALVDNECVEEKKFWGTFFFNFRRLLIDLSGPIFSMFFILIGSLITRKLGLLPHKELPIEVIVWLVLEAYIVIKIVVFIAHGVFSDPAHIKSFDNALVWMVWILVVLQIIGILPKLTAWMERTQIAIGDANEDPVTLWILFTGIITIAVTLFVAKWIGQFFESWFNSIPSIQANIKVVVNRLVKVLLMICAILIGMSAAGIDITVLGVFGGAIGVGLGFGLQKIASNYVSGFIILIDRSIKIGDLVNVAGVEGTITDIKTRYTVVKAFDGSVTIIPNESFVTSNVKNVTYGDGPGRTTVVMSVDYSCNVEEVIDLMTSIVERQPRVLREPKPYTLLTNFGADGIDLTSYFWVPDPGIGTVSLRSAISRAMLKEFNAHGINIPYPQRDVRILSIPDVVCKVESDSNSNQS